MKSNSYSPLLALSFTAASLNANVNFQGNQNVSFLNPSRAMIQTVEGGTDGEVDPGDTWRIDEIKNGIYATLTINSVRAVNDFGPAAAVPSINDFALQPDDGSEVIEHIIGQSSSPSGHNQALAIEFHGFRTNDIGFNFTLDFFNSSDGTPAALTEGFTIFDLDTASNNLVETVKVLGLSSYALDPDTSVTFNGIDGDGYHSFSSDPTLTLQNRTISSLEEQRDVSVEFLTDAATSLTFDWSWELSARSENTRTFYLSGIREFNFVPEPNTALLSLLGLAACLRRRR
ncbi:PEP-CTERM sorting domain-containing protein [Roseibacillus ishigakijimensis]|uniref:PEP-CTERM sorting domain-containing protein n=1 Tax=Roseibacillus ishigakijimensis TaxID=454146 RepID=A0A934RUY2_9BACT|nr:PEP-CTERM sorting domain-containing protein [Roseibacillus ishigakijimensis]MBK1834936.1 PEP-CTERM sorting domain-containing protein [Roseibacillus ishigakijimensis]